MGALVALPPPQMAGEAAKSAQFILPPGGGAQPPCRYTRHVWPFSWAENVFSTVSEPHARELSIGGLVILKFLHLDLKMTSFYSLWTRCASWTKSHLT